MSERRSTEASVSTSPPLPHGRLRAGQVWPPEIGRRILSLLPDAIPVHRHDLVGQQGKAEGSGSSDVIVLQVGGWCLKTSGRRCHSDGEAARAAALAIARLKRGLGTLLPDDTAVAVVEDGRRQWVWTISPWLRTLRAELADAAARGDETCLATALVAFADGAVHSLQLADAAALVLDVHPSNFARQGGRIVYLDDDVGSGSILHAIGHAVLQRVEEYGEHADACETYVKAFESRLQSVLGARQVARLELRRVFEACRMRTEIAGWARDRILRTLWRCR